MTGTVWSLKMVTLLFGPESENGGSTVTESVSVETLKLVPIHEALADKLILLTPLPMITLKVTVVVPLTSTVLELLPSGRLADPPNP